MKSIKKIFVHILLITFSTVVVKLVDPTTPLWGLILINSVWIDSVNLSEKLDELLGKNCSFSKRPFDIINVERHGVA